MHPAIEAFAYFVGAILFAALAVIAVLVVGNTIFH